jgi:hypothetical protein
MELVDGIEQRGGRLKLDSGMVSIDSLFESIRVHGMNLFSYGTQVQGRFSEHPLYSRHLVSVLDPNVSVEDVQVALDVAESGLVEAF